MSIVDRLITTGICCVDLNLLSVILFLIDCLNLNFCSGFKTLINTDVSWFMKINVAKCTMCINFD